MKEIPTYRKLLGEYIEVYYDNAEILQVNCALNIAIFTSTDNLGIKTYTVCGCYADDFVIEIRTFHAYQKALQAYTALTQYD